MKMKIKDIAYLIIIIVLLAIVIFRNPAKPGNNQKELTTIKQQRDSVILINGLIADSALTLKIQRDSMLNSISELKKVDNHLKNTNEKIHQHNVSLPDSAIISYFSKRFCSFSANAH